MHRFPVSGNPFDQAEATWQRVASALREHGVLRIEFTIDLPTLLDQHHDRQLTEIQQMMTTRLEAILGRQLKVSYDGGSGGQAAQAAFLIRF